MLIGLALCPLGCDSPAESSGSNALSAAIDSVVLDHVQQGLVAGASVVVLQADDTLHARGYGLSRIDGQVSATPESLFNVGSVAKLFTGAALSRLAEAGRLSLDDPVLLWLPEFPNPEQGQRITTRSLLNHTSGLSDHLAADLARWETSRAPLTPEWLMTEYLSDLPLDFEPGSHWSYSNAGFFLASLIIERASGKPWFDYINDEILSPLGLRRMRLCNEDPDSVAPGYDATDSGFEESVLFAETGVRGDGGLCASAMDLAHVPRALESGLVVSPTSLSDMLTPTTLSTGVDVPYGLGVRLGRLQGRRSWGHTGGLNGNVAVVTWFPEEEVTIVVVTNTVGTEADGLTIYEAVVGRVLDIETTPPSRLVTDSADLLPYTGRYRGGRNGAVYDVGIEAAQLVVSQIGREAITRLTYLGDHTFARADGEVPLDRYVFQLSGGIALAYTGYYNGLPIAFRQRIDD